MINIKSKDALSKMRKTGQLLSCLLDKLKDYVSEGKTTLDLDTFVADYLKENNMISCTKGYMGYRHVSCISVNDVVVHGVPTVNIKLKQGDLVKIDVCASFNGYCADMARCFFIGEPENPEAKKLVEVAKAALNKGIAQAQPGNRLTDISAAIQKEVEKHGYGIVKEFAGHGIGKCMHEDPEILNYGPAGRGPRIKPGMAFAIEPMITMGRPEVYIAGDRWTVKTRDKSLAAHTEDTVIITEEGPEIITRNSC